MACPKAFLKDFALMCPFVSGTNVHSQTHDAAMRAIFQEMITNYIKKRDNLINTFVFIDCRHDPQKIDLEFMEWCGMEGIPFSIVFTKIDKLGSSSLMKQVAQYKKKLLLQWEALPPVFMTSAEGRTGREELLLYIDTVHQSISPSMYIKDK